MTTRDVSRLLGALGDTANPLSPLHPEHPLRKAFDSVRSTGKQSQTPSSRRPPPLFPLPDHDASVSALVYGRPGTFDKLPVPNLEWWWNTIEFEASDGKSYFIVTNVMSFGSLSGPPLTCGTIAVFDVKSGQRWQVRSVGAVNGERNAAYQAPGWWMARLDPQASTFAADSQKAAQSLGVSSDELVRACTHGCYVINVDTPELRARIYLEQGQSVLYGEPDTPGWFDNNSKGLMAYWASYRSRFQTPRGSVELGPRGHARRVYARAGHARFDHQSLHWSLADKHAAGAPGLLEQLATRPKWNWYHARLAGDLNVMAYSIWDVHTGRILRRAAAVSHERLGTLARAREDSITFSSDRTQGDLRAPVGMRVSFNVPEACPGVPAGNYRLVFDYNSATDWNIDYAVGHWLVLRAQEAYCHVSGSTPSGATLGTGTQEVLDLVGSLNLARTWA